MDPRHLFPLGQPLRHQLRSHPQQPRLHETQAIDGLQQTGGVLRPQQAQLTRQAAGDLEEEGLSWGTGWGTGGWMGEGG